MMRPRGTPEIVCRVRRGSHPYVRLLMNGVVIGTVLLAVVVAGAEVTPGAAEQPTVMDTRQVCQYLTRHQPAADVAYKPGVDAQGRPVVSADLPRAFGSRAKIEPKVEFKLSPDLVQKYTNNLPASVAAMLGEATPGRITVEGQRVSYNGTFLSDTDQAKLVAVCRDMLK